RWIVPMRSESEQLWMRPNPEVALRVDLDVIRATAEENLAALLQDVGGGVTVVDEDTTWRGCGDVQRVTVGAYVDPVRKDQILDGRPKLAVSIQQDIGPRD